eukprot:GFKZ01001309.1.p1 GENE.GFKZ01001309.1~~GFKZ01001309.1.p1  ORF type:complete len:239 (-),score=83.69 GFKZ01001309.1:379-1095(-)
MGRTLKIWVESARDLYNADADEGGISDPYVIVCFDRKVDQELCRTAVVSETTCPEWNETFEVDITKHIETVVEETGEEPQMITFCVYDGDAGESEALGVAAVRFEELVKTGKVEGELEVVFGTGVIVAGVEMKKVRLGSMLKEDAALKIAGGVVGVAAVGVLGTYLYQRYQKKKEKLKDSEEDVEVVRTGIAYGADVDDDDDEEEEKGQFKKWWEMDDEEDDDDDENRWTGVDDDDEE